VTERLALQRTDRMATLTLIMHYSHTHLECAVASSGRGATV